MLQQIFLLLLTAFTVRCIATEPEKDCGGPADPCHQCKVHNEETDTTPTHNELAPCWQLVELLNNRNINYGELKGQELEDFKREILTTVYFTDCIQRHAVIKDMLLRDTRVKGQLRATLTFIDDTIDEQQGNNTLQAALDRYELRQRARSLRVTKRRHRSHSRLGKKNF